MDDFKPEDLEAAHEELQPSPLDDIAPKEPPEEEKQEEVWIADELPADFVDEAPPPAAADTTARNFGMAAHLAGFGGFVFPFGNILGPLIVWLMGRDKSPFVDDQGKEALNFQITWTIYTLISFVLLLVLIGLALLAILAISWLILTIVAAVKAANGESYRYPFTWRLIK